MKGARGREEDIEVVAGLYHKLLNFLMHLEPDVRLLGFLGDGELKGSNGKHGIPWGLNPQCWAFGMLATA